MADADLVAACERAVAEKQLTSGGLPKVDFLEAVVGREVTAAERDDAWAEWQANQKTGPAIPAAATPGPVVYVGPTVRLDGMLVSRNTVFSVLPEAVQKVAESDQDFDLMLVDPAKLPIVINRLADPESRLARAYRAVQDQAGKRGEA